MRKLGTCRCPQALDVIQCIMDTGIRNRLRKGVEAAAISHPAREEICRIRLRKALRIGPAPAQRCGAALPVSYNQKLPVVHLPVVYDADDVHSRPESADVQMHRRDSIGKL